MTKKNIITVTALMLLILITSSCRHCMCCGRLIGDIQCINGTDTVARHTDPGVGGNIADSLNYYQGNGYTCASHIYPFVGSFAGGGQYCGTKNISSAEAMGNGCVFPRYEGDCDF